MRILKFKTLLGALSIASLLLMTACGGGGGGGGESPGGGGGGGAGGGGGSSGTAKPGDNRYLPYFASLHLVDTENPASTPIEISPNNVDFMSLFATTDFNVATGETNNFRFTDMVYAEGGRLYRVDITTDSDLTPVQVSSETDFTNVCEEYTDTLSDSSNQGILIYEKAGMDGVCYPRDDNTYSMVMINQNSTSDPVDLTGIISNVFNLQPLVDFTGGTPVHTGYLVQHSNTELRHYNDVNFSSFTTITGTTYVEIVDGSSAPGKIFVAVDYELFVYDVVTEQLGSPVFAGEMPWWIYCKADNCAFTVWDGLTGLADIYSLPADGSGSATLLASDLALFEDNYLFSEIVLTDTKIFYVEGDSVTGLQLLKSVPYTGGTPTALDSAELINISAVRNNIIFYNTDYDIYAWTTGSSSVATDSTAIIIQEDGTPLNSFAQSAWVGFNFNNISQSTGQAAEYVILANNYTDLATGLAGATVESYSASDGALVNTLGVLDSDMFAFSFVAFGSHGLGGVAAVNPVTDPMSPPPTVTSNDIVYADPTVENSLTRVTDTDNFPEWVGF